MNYNVQNLYDFIERAENNRQYPSNTAMGYKNALNLVIAELNEEEKASLDILKSNLDKIFHSIFTKNKNLTPKTLETYKYRVRLVIRDFEAHGTDPAKMASWNRKVRARSNTKVNKEEGATQHQSVIPITSTETRIPEPGSTMTRFELPLRPDAKAIILTPSDLSIEEVGKIKIYIESLEKIAELKKT